MTMLEDETSEAGFYARYSWRALRAVLMCGAVALSGCATMNPHRFVAARPAPSIATPMMPQTVTNAARASTAYERDPKDASVAIAYARALRQFGNNPAAADVLARTVQYHPDNSELLGEYAKALTASGQNQAALPVFASAEKLDKSDWSLFSAEGIALDQLGRHGQARDRYETALKLSPDNPDVLCNLAFSYTLSGDLTEAEVILRKAVKQRDASAQARQNLAMVVGLQGRFTEAQALSRADLDVATADHNVAIMKQMFAEPERWSVAHNDERGPSLASNAPAGVMTDAVASVANDSAPAPIPTGVTAAIRPAMSAVPAKVKAVSLAPAVVQTPAPKIDPAVAVTPVVAPTPVSMKPAVSSPPAASPQSAVPAVRHHAPPSAQSEATGKPLQFAQANEVDDTFFAFNW
jgi:Flp pilus assembly protein TadD